MLRALAFLQNFITEPVRREDLGLSAVEYALLLALVVVGLIAALKIFGKALQGPFSSFKF